MHFYRRGGSIFREELERAAKLEQSPTSAFAQRVPGGTQGNLLLNHDEGQPSQPGTGSTGPSGGLTAGLVDEVAAGGTGGVAGGASGGGAPGEGSSRGATAQAGGEFAKHDGLVLHPAADAANASERSSEDSRSMNQLHHIRTQSI